MRKSVVMLMLLLVGLLAMATVSAVDNNLTDDVVGIEINDEISVNSVDTTDVPISNDKNSSQEVNDINSKNDNEEILSSVENKDVLCDSPPYNAYSVNVSNVVINYGSDATILMNITSASSMYDYKYNFIFAIYDYDGHPVLSKRYCSNVSASQETYYMYPNQLSPGTYFILIINGYDDKQMATSTLYVKSSPPHTAYSINVEDVKIKYGESESVIINITPANSTYFNKYDFYLNIYDSEGNKKISRRYTNTSYINHEVCVVNSTQIGSGIYTIKLENFDDYYVMDTAKLNVLITSNFKIASNDYYVNEQVKINYSIDSIATGDLKVYLDNNYVKSVLVGNIIDLGYLTSGKHTIKVIYDGDELYLPCESSGSFEIHKLTPNFSLTNNNVAAYENLTIYCSLNNDAMGTVTLNGLTTQVINGKANFTINNIQEGLHQFNINYSGDEKYNSISKSINVTIKSKEINDNPNVQYPDFTFPKLIITTPYYKYSGGDIITYWTGNLNCYFKLYKGNKLIFNKYLTPHGSGVSTDDGYSEYSYLTKKLAIGSYTVKIIAPNGALYTKKSFKVTKMPTYIDCPNVKVKYGTTKYITVEVYRKLDNDWASGTVKFTINGKTYKAKLKQGEAKIKIKVPSKIKIYTCKVKFLENSKYKGSSKKFKLIVKKTIVLKSKTTTKSVSLYTKAKHTLKVNVKDSDGNKVKSGTVKVKVNGKTYKAKIRNGVAKVKITAPSKTGKYSCKATYAGGKQIRGSTASFTIKVKPRYVDVIVPVKLNEHIYNSNGAYSAESYKWIELTSDNRQSINISVTPYKNGKHLYGDKTGYWVHYKNGDWDYVGKGRLRLFSPEISGTEVYAIDKVKVRFWI